MTNQAPTYAEAGLPTLDGSDPAGSATADAPLAVLMASGASLAASPFGVAVLRYDDVGRLLRDPRLRRPGQEMLLMQGVTEGRLFERTKMVLPFMDGDDHQRLRRLVVKAFTPRAVDRIRPRMREAFGARLAEVAPRGRCEAVADLCADYPIQVICALIGAPSDASGLFSEWAESILKGLTFEIAANRERIEAAIDAWDGYVSDLIDVKRADPGDDLLSALIAVEEEGERLTHEELLAVTMTLLTAGTDTTRNQLAVALHAFATHPEQWDLLAANPDLMPAAVEEAIRYNPVGMALPRIAREDIELHGVRIPAGSFVALMSGGANKDPDALADPFDFDITRSLPSSYQLYTFGGGLHYCIGASVAKTELQEALTLAVKALPDLRPDGDMLVGGEPTWGDPFHVWWPGKVPLRWSTAA